MTDQQSSANCEVEGKYMVFPFILQHIVSSACISFQPIQLLILTDDHEPLNEPFPLLQVFPQLEMEILLMIHSRTETDWTEHVSDYQTSSHAI